MPLVARSDTCGSYDGTELTLGASIAVFAFGSILLFVSALSSRLRHGISRSSSCRALPGRSGAHRCPQQAKAGCCRASPCRLLITQSFMGWWCNLML